MPIYEYRCNQCEREFEKYVQGAQARIECPACASERVTRRLSMVGVRSSGSSAPSMGTSMQGGGGCCGGGCGCH